MLLKLLREMRSSHHRRTAVSYFFKDSQNVSEFQFKVSAASWSTRPETDLHVSISVKKSTRVKAF